VKHLLLRYIFFGLVTVYVTSSFVKPIGPSQYEVHFDEHGANFSQKMTVDKINGLVISEVPDHNDIIAHTFYYDSDTGLLLEVCNRTKTSSIHRAFVALDAEQTEANLEAVANNKTNEDRLVLNSATSTGYDLISIDGPEIELECVPEKFKKFIPTGHRILLTRQVQRTEDNTFPGKKSPNIILIDPSTQKRYNYGDTVNLFDDAFDDILPSCALNNAKRQKRNTETQTNKPTVRTYTDQEVLAGYARRNYFWYNSNRVCRDQNMNIIPRCSSAPVTCPEGCDIDKVGYDCKHKTAGCHFVLVCPVVAGSACIAHIRSADQECSKCCRMRDCGPILKECEYMPVNDICPDPSIGCPIDNVIQKSVLPKLQKRCNMDDSCDSIMDNSVTWQSGVSCQYSERYRRQPKFCCKDKKTYNTNTNLPDCSEPDWEKVEYIRGVEAATELPTTDTAT